MMNRSFVLVVVSAITLFPNVSHGQAGSGERNDVSWSITPVWLKTNGVEGTGVFEPGDQIKCRWRVEVFNDSDVYVSFRAELNIVCSDSTSPGYGAASDGLLAHTGNIIYVEAATLAATGKTYFDLLNLYVDYDSGGEDQWDYNSMYFWSE